MPRPPPTVYCDLYRLIPSNIPSMNHVIFLSVPGLRRQDLYHMPRLAKLAAGGEVAALKASFPAVTWPVQANMLTGKCPSEHGVIANGFYWRESRELEMWT